MKTAARWKPGLRTRPALPRRKRGGVEVVAAFGEGPAVAVVDFAEGEKVGGNVVVAGREDFFGNGELVHEGKTEVMFFGGEIDFVEAVGELPFGFPTDLAAQAGFI